MRRREQTARMPFSLTVPEDNLVAGPAAALRALGSPVLRWFDATERQRRAESRSRTDCLDGIRVAYFFTLFACASLFGLFVGGYVGYMDAATPPADSPYSVAVLATSDVQWNAMMRQYSALHRPLDSAAERVQEPFWQRLAAVPTLPGRVLCMRRSPGRRPQAVSWQRRSSAVPSGWRRPQAPSPMPQACSTLPAGRCSTCIQARMTCLG
jgi:hypothetical protein